LIIRTQPLYLGAQAFRTLFELFGPTLGFWRAAEIAAFREAAALPDFIIPPVLDLGCGDGLVTSFVLPQVAIGLDPDQHALSRAAGLGVYEAFEPNAMESAGIAPGSLNTIISNSVLEHATHIDAALQAAAAALCPGGHLVFSTPTEAFSRWLALPVPGYAAARNRHFLHYNLWPVEDWARHLERAGFEIVYVRPYLRAGWVRAWDGLELIQQARIGRGERLFSRVWKRLPETWLDLLAQRAANVDLAAPEPGGGRLVVARKNIGGDLATDHKI
jgi:SAM-dependent methyltransferase